MGKVARAEKRRKRKAYWDNNAEWQVKKPVLMKRLKAEARKRRKEK